MRPGHVRPNNLRSKFPGADPLASRSCLLSTRLSAVLTVALHYFAFRCEPIVGFVAQAGSALLIEFVGTSPYFVFEVDGNHILSDIGFPDLEHLFCCCFRPGFGLGFWRG